MTKPSLRSRTFRRIFVRIPSGESVLRHKRRRNAKPQCASCGGQMPGVARGTKTQVRALPKSSRRPERPYGGALCSACMRKTIIAKVRAQ